MSIEDVISKIRSMHRAKVKAGVLEGSTYGDGKSVAQVAMWNEYGVAIPVSDRMRGFLGANGLHLKKTTKQLNIPPRPFMRNTVSDKSDAWQERAVENLRECLVSDRPVQDALENVGMLMQADIQETIDSNMQPPNHPFTSSPKEARVVDKSGKPISGQSGTKQTLIDSGTLIKSISYEVEQ